MAARAAFRVEHIGVSQAADISVDVSVIGFDPNNIVDAGLSIPVSFGSSSAQTSAALAAAVQGYLESVYGYVFAGGDTVERI